MGKNSINASHTKGIVKIILSYTHSSSHHNNTVLYNIFLLFNIHNLINHSEDQRMVQMETVLKAPVVSTVQINGINNILCNNSLVEIFMIMITLAKWKDWNFMQNLKILTMSDIGQDSLSTEASKESFRTSWDNRLDSRRIHRGQRVGEKQPAWKQALHISHNAVESNWKGNMASPWQHTSQMNPRPRQTSHFEIWRIQREVTSLILSTSCPCLMFIRSSNEYTWGSLA